MQRGIGLAASRSLGLLYRMELTYAHYHTNTAKFPNHNVGVPSAGSLYKSESSFRMEH
jgi:hypothetical protein